jgi:hypothetical protein
MRRGLRPRYLAWDRLGASILDFRIKTTSFSRVSILPRVPCGSTLRLEVRPACGLDGDVLCVHAHLDCRIVSVCHHLVLE